MPLPVRMPREDGAWYMALTCWICGWGTAWRPAWEPLVLAFMVVGLLAAAQAFRRFRRLASADAGQSRRALLGALTLSVAAAAPAVLLKDRFGGLTWWVALAAPALMYAPLLLSGAERHAAARVLAVVAITAIAPATFLASGGLPGWIPAVLWAALGGYFVLGALFVMARIRRRPAALLTARLLATAAAAGALLAAPSRPVAWFLAAPFAVLAVRAWAWRTPEATPDPRRIGRAETAFAAVSALLVLAGIRMT